MSVIRKAVGGVVAGSDDGFGAFHVLLSTPGLDRDGDRLHVHEWKTPLPGRITFDLDHGMSVEKTIGSGVPFLTARGLEVHGTFASTPLAQMTRTLVTEGHVTTTSVAFRETKVPAGQGKTAIQRELLNGAFVAIPANPEALVLAAKYLGGGYGRGYGGARSMVEKLLAETTNTADVKSAVRDAQRTLAELALDDARELLSSGGPAAAILAALLAGHPVSPAVFDGI